MRNFPDWFTGGAAEHNFTTQLTQHAGKPNLRYLQIGAYAGDATQWLMEHILTHHTSTLTDVDTWAGSPETDHHPINFHDVQNWYHHHRPPRVETRHMTSHQFFTTNHTTYDFIYIDGSHEAADVLHDAINAYHHTNIGGTLAFDDYQWNDYNRPHWNKPHTAINAFETCHRDRLQLTVNNVQRWYTRIK